MKRPSIPVAIRRKVLIESGYRCAIPTCRYPITEKAHIDSWAETKDHSLQNLIALCPNCHTRYDKEEISREAIIHYKKKLTFLNDLYTKFELDTLDYLRENRVAVMISEILIKRLLDEKLVKIEGIHGWQPVREGEMQKDIPFLFSIMLTKKGEELISDWNNY